MWYWISRSKSAIIFSNDVSNEFDLLSADRNMVYSCGYFRSPDDSLEQARMRKIDHILTRPCVQLGDRLLDIGR